jgi:hypothetical protein
MILATTKGLSERGHASTHKAFLDNVLQRHAVRQTDQTSAIRRKTFDLDVKFPGPAQLSYQRTTDPEDVLRRLVVKAKHYGSERR